MITRLKLKPGQKGTRALVEKYGESLVCVRYRYDDASRTRIKTVELIVERKELSSTRKIIKDNVLVAVSIAYGEKELDRLAKKSGGRWDPDVKLWYVPQVNIQGTDLGKNVILDAGKKKEDK